MRAVIVIIAYLFASETMRAGAEPALDPAARIRAAMQAALDQQQNSVRKQVEAIRSATLVTAAADSNVAPGEPACDPVPEPQLASLVGDAAKREDMQPNLIRAVIQQESAGRACAVSPKGAQGLMQIMPATAVQFSVSDPFDPRQNIDAGTKFLKQLLAKYGGDLSKALGAYNAGPGRVDKERGVPQNAETQNYVADILSKLKD